MRGGKETNVSQTSLRLRNEFWERVRKEFTSKENQRGSYPQKKLAFFYYSQENSLLSPGLATMPPSIERITRYIRFIVCQGANLFLVQSHWLDRNTTCWVMISKKTAESCESLKEKVMFLTHCSNVWFYLFFVCLFVCLFLYRFLHCKLGWPRTQVVLWTSAIPFWLPTEIICVNRHVWLHFYQWSVWNIAKTE